MRVNTVDRCRKSPGTCGRCGTKITEGMGYRWAKGRYTGKKVRCLNAACHFRPSDLTGSDKLSRLYSAREEVEDVLATDFDDADEVRSALETAAGEAREVGEEYAEASSNLDGRLNAEELDEKAQQCENWADELEGVDVEDFEPTPTVNEDQIAKEADRKDEWREEIRGNAQAALDSLEL
jgi:hypothetical protein